MQQRTKRRLALTILSLGLSLSAAACATYDPSKGHGNDGLGKEGVDAVVRGDIGRADAEFHKDYVTHPSNPLAVFNKADSLHAHGQIEEADMLYRQAAESGKGYIPDILLEPHDSKTTVRDVACMHLAQDGKADPNCPNFRAELNIVTPPPAPAAPPAPPPPPAVAEAPPPPAPLMQAPATVAVRDFVVFFDFDKTNITPEARGVIAAAVEAAKKNGAIRIRITGHTDTVGTQSYNQRLSERRAEAVKNEMVRLGMNTTDIATVGRSFDDPLVPTGPGVREPQNRRAVIDLGQPNVAGGF
jgi:outer membrane protein OmpA-like peptidoglycan-associated protein